MLVVGLSLSLGPLSLTRAQDASAAPSRIGNPSSYATELVRRVARLEPALLTALSAARDAHNVASTRCLDRALGELHGVERQVGYHAQSWSDQGDDVAQHERHVRALTILSARLDYLAASIERCSASGAPVRNGTTRVEVIIPQR